MIEDLQALDEIDAIAATDGLDIIAIGPSDLARALGVAGQADHPKLVQAVERIADATRRAGKARLAIPLANPQLPRNLAELKALGVGYTNCGPAPEVRLLRAFTRQVTELREGPG
jgi:2-keto-3-deoxy-L-rhamnonate aldolase RhmA